MAKTKTAAQLAEEHTRLIRQAVATRDQLQARLGRRASGAAGVHADRRTRRQRDRGAQRRRAVAEGLDR